MLCALGPEPASQAMRTLHNIYADRGIFVIDRAASAGNAHWVCSWFAVADNHKMKPKEFLDFEMCRKPLGAESIISDVRCERLSAAAIRQCSHAANGCTFKGNRAFVTAHDALCDFVPPAVLRNEIQKLNEALLANSTNFERMKAEKTKLQQELINCALGPEPAASAMRVLHHISAGKAVFVIDRAAASGNSQWICSWFESEFVPFQQKLTPQQYLQQIQQYQPQPSAADLDLIRRTLMVTVSVAIFAHASVMCY